MAAVAVVVGLWAWRAFSDTHAYDFGLAYVGGQVAWGSGHPETWFSWTGTPVLAVVMAVMTRLWNVTTAGRVMTGVNLLLVVGAVAVVVCRLRRRLPPVWLWVVAVALASFGPVISSVWWKQFNLVSVVLALAGFEYVRRERDHLGGALIGLSIAFKPLAVLLPLVLLAGRRTRRAGVWSIVYAVGSNLAALGLIAAHAHAVGALNPWLSVKNFADKSKPAAGLACAPQNFAPQAWLCHAVGSHHWTFQEIAVWAVLAVMAVLVVRALRGYDTATWESFAFACAISTMASPIAWSHYQVMLAPLFVLLVVQFVTHRASGGYWVGLAAAFVCASLIWSPYGAVTDALQWRLPSVYTPNPHPLLTEIAQYAQYILIATGAVWYARRLQPRRVATPDVRASASTLLAERQGPLPNVG